MGKRAGGGAAGAAAAAAAASTSAGAGVEPAARRGGGPRSAAAGLLGALHLVLSLVVAAARAEKEAFIQSESIIEVLRFDDGGLLQATKSSWERCPRYTLPSLSPKTSGGRKATGSAFLQSTTITS